MNELVRRFALQSRQNDVGATCDASGVALAGVPLLIKTPAGFQPRSIHELDLLIKAAYGASLDASLLRRGLAVAAEALNGGDMERAMIGTLHLRLPPLDKHSVPRLVRVDDLISKYNYNPDEPRDWHGRWTADGGTPPMKPDAGAHEASRPNQNIDEAESLTPAAYRGVYHDEEVREFAAELRSRGQIVVTEVPLTMADGSAGTRLDILARDPTTGIVYGVEVKTGDRPFFTPGQLVVYPHFMMGESVLAGAKAAAVGLLPNVPLPPIPLYLSYRRNALSEREINELDPAKMSRYYRGH